MAPDTSATLLHQLETSRLYSEELGIDLPEGGDPALFRWFLACQLMGARINEPIAMRTYDSFVRHGLVTPRAILHAGWDTLVNPVLREGGYVRYDESKSRQLLRTSRMLLDTYGGSLERLRDEATSPRDLEERLLAFYGVGPVTVNIFLRELRHLWTFADPTPLPRVLELADWLGIDLRAVPRKSDAYARIEAGLIRLMHRHPKGFGTPTSRQAYRRLVEAGVAAGAPSGH
jgi:endonuclease III